MHSQFLFIVIFMHSINIQSTIAYRTFSMLDLGSCSRNSVSIIMESMTWNSSGILVSSLNNTYKPGLHCTVSLRPPMSYGIVISIKKIDLGPPSRNYGDCKTYLELAPVAGSKTKRLCGYSDDNYEFKAFTYGGELDVVFHISNSTRYKKAFFQLTFTSVRKVIIEDHCKRGIETVIVNTSKLNPAGTLKATGHPPYKPNKHCTVVIKAPAGYGIVLSVRKIDFRPNKEYICDDYIKVFHSDFTLSPSIICDFKFDLEEQISFYTKGPMTVIYHTEPEDNQAFNFEEGFALTYTVVSEDVQDCKSDSKFMCDNGRCISDEMTCDGRNNCGDRSDESQLLCSSDFFYSFKMTDIIYAAVFAVMILATITTYVVVFARKRKMNDDSSSISDQDEPTARLTPYQAVHPAGFFICQNPAGPHSVLPQHSKHVQSEVGFSNPCYPTGVPQPPPSYSQ